MPGQAQRPRRFVPTGLSDATDGSEAFAGACARLANLIPQPNARGVFVPRPAMQVPAQLPDWGGGPVGKMVSIGNIFYGFYASAQFIGYDRPFRYDPLVGFTTISGMATANLPTTQPTTGDWQPPSIAQVAGRIVFTHPGFPGGSIKFGWLDISGFSATITGNITTGSTIVSAPSNLTGLQPGMTFAGTGIPAGALIASLDPNAVTITLSAAATATSTGTSFTVAGGTVAAPLWGAGDMSGFPLAGTAPAVFVAPYSGRAWFGVNLPDNVGAVQASDAGTACVQTNISQTLQFATGSPVTTAAGMPLSSQLGGVVQSLMVFHGDSLIQQITGDFIYNNIAVNALQTATGTLSPDSVASTPRGLLFAASDGLRLIGFDGSVSDPIGTEGQGLSLPFTNAVTPSRTHAGFNENLYRVTVSWQPPPPASLWGTAQRTDEFWFHFSELGRPFGQSRWSGPHSCLLDAAAAWPATNSFVVAPQNARGYLYRSDPRPTASTSYSELGQTLTCDLKTLLLPDNPQQNAIEVIETTLWLAYASQLGEVLATATDDLGQQLDRTYVWIGPFTIAAQRPIPWHQPLVFRQMSLELVATAIAQLQIGAINLRDEVLNYQLPYPVPGEFVLGTSVLGGPGVLGA